MLFVVTKVEAAIYILQTTDAPIDDTQSVEKRSETWLTQEIRTHSLPYLCILVFVLTTILISTIRGDTFLPFVFEYLERVMRTVLLAGSAIIIVLSIRALAQGRRHSPISTLVSSLSRLALSGKPVRFLFACTVLAVLLAAFLYNKMLIPELVPFRWDATFARLDAALFLGHQPWELLQPLLGATPATFFLDVVYSFWVPMVFLFWAGAFVSPRVPIGLRVRFWMATIVSWILIGLLMATAMSSAGPCYFAEFVHDMASPYVGLNDYLSDVAARHMLSSALTKAALWQTYTGQSDLPGGISAMPSMHNAQAALFVAFAYSVSRRFGHMVLVYAILIFVGSIHLGWHYAIDGIVGVVAALTVWYLCGRFLRVTVTHVPTQSR